MRTSSRLRNSLCAAALALLGLSACGPNYAIYKVHVTSASPRDDIKVCRFTVKNEDKAVVVDEIELAKEYTTEPGGSGLALKQGCDGGLTKPVVGDFSYSTSRSSGSLYFIVTGWGGPDNLTPIQQRMSDPKEVKAYPPEITVEVALQRCDINPSPCKPLADL